MSKLVCTTLVVVENQEDRRGGGVTSADDPLAKDMQKVTCSMDIGEGDKSDTKIVNYKKQKKPSQPFNQVQGRGSQHLYCAPKRLTWLIVVNPLGF
jgi:hypothetical protein